MKFSFSPVGSPTSTLNELSLRLVTPPDRSNPAKNACMEKRISPQNQTNRLFESLRTFFEISFQSEPGLSQSAHPTGAAPGASDKFPQQQKED